MTKEEIIAIAIREAFKCGREAGEHYQALLDNKQQQLEEACDGKPDHDLKQYDGFYSQLNNVAPDSVLLENSSLKAIIKVREEENKKLTEENLKLGRICEEKDATITDLRQELQANKDADTLLCDENRRLLESLTAKDAEIAKLRLMVPEVKPMQIDETKEPTDCIKYSEGDKVIISGQHFADPSQRYIGKIVDVTRDFARVAIQGGDMDGEEHNVPYNLLAHFLETEDPSAYACGSFNSKPRKKKLPEE